MKERKKKGNIIAIANVIIPFLGPLAYEVANSITGDWTNKENKFNLSTGKVVTLLIGAAYIIAMVILVCYNEKKRKSVENLQYQVDELRREISVYKKSNETLCTLLAYLDEKIKSQIEYLKEHNKIDVRDLNINSAAATIAKIIYQNIMEESGQNIKVTVNVYDRINNAGAEYSIMIAHEGHVSQPSVFGVSRVLAQGKKGTRFCEKILLSNSPDYRILLSKKEVAKAFSQNINKCKYNQYLGIPIRKMGGTNIALMEIVAHDDTVVWNTKDEAVQFAANYCEVLKEYILLMDRIYEQGKTIAEKVDGGGA